MNGQIIYEAKREDNDAYIKGVLCGGQKPEDTGKIFMYQLERQTKEGILINWAEAIEIQPATITAIGQDLSELPVNPPEFPKRKKMEDMGEREIEALEIMLANYAHNGTDAIECCDCPSNDYCISVGDVPFTPEEVLDAYIELNAFLHERANKPTEREEPAAKEDIPMEAREIGWREFTLREAHTAVCTDRNKQYGEPEKSFTAIGIMWTAYLHAKGYLPLDIEITDEDAALMLAAFKMARLVTAQNPKPDTFADIAGYAACACECAMIADGSRAVIVEDWTGEEKIETRKE